ncbi:MAG: ATP-binding protein [Dehalococcoidia bacterium]
MNIYALIPFISVSAYLVLTAMVLRTPWKRVHRALALYLFSAMAWSFSSFMLHANFFPQQVVFWNQLLVVVMVWMTVNYYHFVRAFLARPGGLGVYLGYALVVAFASVVAGGYVVKSAYVVDGVLYNDLGIWPTIMGLVGFSFVGAAAYLLARQYRTLRDPTSRSRVTYLLIGVAVVTVFGLSNFVSSLAKFPVDHIGNLFNAMLISYAILRYQLVEVNVVLRKGLTYLIWALVSLSAYSLVLFLLRVFFDVRLGFMILVAVGGGLVPLLAVLFHPLRQSSQEWVERLFFRGTYDYRRLLVTFTSRVGDVLDLEELARNMLHPITRALRSTKVGLLLPDTEGDFRPRFVQPAELESALAGVRLSREGPIVAWLTREGKALRRDTIAINPEFKSLWKTEMEDLNTLDMELFCPLRSKGILVGILAVGKKHSTTPYSNDDIDLLMTMATQAAITIENARILDDLKKERARVEQLLAKTVLAQEEERKRVSVELHDSVAQWLVGASYRIQTCNALLARTSDPKVIRELQEIATTIQESVKALREVMVGLHPPDLDELGFVPALGQMMEGLKREGIGAQLQVDGTPVRLPPHMETAVYRVVQEAITNVRKHAAATQVKAKLWFDPDQIRVEISDNGKGFDLFHTLGSALSQRHMGLLGMRQRVETLGGSLRIRSNYGAGTSVLLTLPVEAGSVNGHAEGFGHLPTPVDEDARR